MRKRLIAMTTGAVAVLLAGCGGGDTGRPTLAAPPPPASVAPPKLVTGSPTYDRIRKRGKLVAGVAESPGLAERNPDSGAYSGFEVEIGRLLASKLGLTEQDVLFKPLPAGLRRDAVANQDVDVQIGGLTPASSARGTLAVTGPYLATPPALLTALHGDVTSVDAVRGRPVCLPNDSVALAAVQQAGLNIHVGESVSDCVNQLGNGTVVAVADDAAPLLGLASTAPERFTVLDLPGPRIDHVVGVASRDKPIEAKIDDILRGAVQDGDWQQRYDRTLGKANGLRLTPPSAAASSVEPTPTPPITTR